eukprot:1368301-Prymnesium_polylepis.2
MAEAAGRNPIGAATEGNATRVEIRRQLRSLRRGRRHLAPASVRPHWTWPPAVGCPPSAQCTGPYDVGARG